MTHPAPLLFVLAALVGGAVLAGCAAAGGAATADATAPLTTRAEQADYRETSTYADVAAFLGELEERGADRRGGVAVSTFGETVEGRALPLAVWGAPSAAAARATGKTRVLVVADIHGGEVAGKEAALAVLRDLAAGRHDDWADSLVVAVAPLYNADGNERIAHDNRPLQLGPVGGMGERTNAQGLDLNRDFTKLASPEARALVGLIRDLDPHVVLDLHTTNGTLMGYDLTYAPPLSPATPPAVDRELWERWLPAVTAALRARYDLATYHYGNVPGAFGEAATAPRGWYSFSPQPRFSTNYVGLRGRFGILAEAYSYAPFAERVAASKRFVEEVLDYASRHASRIRALADEADRDRVVGEEVAVRATFAALPEPVEVLLGEADTVSHPVTGAPMLRRRDVRRPETMPAFVRFAASETTTAPAVYVVTGEHKDAVVRLLDAHGIAYREEYVWGVAREAFRVDSVAVAERPSQGVQMQEVWGQWEPVPAETGSPPRLAPSLVVPVDQPLGRLVVALLDPRSDDGVVAWGVVPAVAWRPGQTGPIQRVPGGVGE
ncbi:M14 family metallopeptidase [Rubrivirga litoralis]|uniref:M14 family metallopeptidase n=1 Tax=Rubrivirga litoralis TaxID=3075598 RepID=A0ABU3BTG5_9BACT|nr:M14 family metallopeptidase [Rubrivirga sp. F394]MDT0632525.1 M14 family metallopeptidase [Rubrivirga sp. F394]